MSRTIQPHIITDDSALGGQIIDGSLKFNVARTNYLKRYPSVDGNKKPMTSIEASIQVRVNDSK